MKPLAIPSKQLSLRRLPGGATARCYLALFAALLVGGVASLSAATPPGRIVFGQNFAEGTDHQSHYETFSVSPNGGGLTQLTRTPGTSFLPDLSPDGTKIIFDSDLDGGGLHLMNADGTGIVNLPALSGFTEAAWSPDGSRFALLGGPGGSDLWVSNADGSNLIQLSSGYLPVVTATPTWSPDGTKVAVSGYTYHNGYPTGYGIFVAPSDGSAPGRYITDVDTQDVRSPSWSPDGTRLVAVSGSSASGLVFVDASTGALTPLTVAGSSDFFDDPAWSPDGTKIAATNSSIGGLPLSIMNADGTGVVTYPTGQALKPRWSKAGGVSGDTITIPGVANLYNADIDATDFANTVNGAGQQPIQVPIAVGADGVQAISFPSVTGGVYIDANSQNGGNGANSPDGGPYFAPEYIAPLNGISGYSLPNTGALIGMFVSYETAQTGQTPPASLDFTSAGLGTDFTMLSPALGQVFFIGNGKASDGTLQSFNIPSGATVLLLGIADGGDSSTTPKTANGYADNGGSFSATYAFGAGNFPPVTPVITSPLTATGTDGHFFYYQIQASNSPSSYSASSLPPGLSFDSDFGVISGYPSQTGTYSVTLSASNDKGAGTPVTLVITVGQDGGGGGGITGVITSPLTATATPGQPFNYQVTVSGFTPTQYLVDVFPDALPDGLNIDSNTGLIFGTTSQVGTYQITLYASDSAGDAATAVLTLTVGSGGTTSGTADLVLTGSANLSTVLVGGQVRCTFTLTNNGPDKATGLRASAATAGSSATLVTTGSLPGIVVGPNNTYSFVLPSLASGATESGTIVFTVNEPGTFSLSAGVTGSQTDPTPTDANTLIVVTATQGSTAAHAPVITAAPGGQILQGDDFRYQVTTDGTVAVDTYSATGLPDGLSIDASSGLISGTLAADAALGDFTVTLRAANGAGASTAMRTFTVVAVPDAPKLADVTGSFGDVKLKVKADKGKYKLTGSVTLENLGSKAVKFDPTKPNKALSVAAYLSAGPTVSYPVDGTDLAAAGLLPLVVGADLTTGSVSVTLPKDPTVPVAPLVLPFGLGKAGSPGASLNLPVTATLKSTDIPAQVASGQYRYLVVVLDPAGTLKESHKGNNVVSIDLQALFAQALQQP